MNKKNNENYLIMHAHTDEFKLLNEQKNRTYKALNDCLMTSKIIKKINQE